MQRNKQEHKDINLDCKSAAVTLFSLRSLFYDIPKEFHKKVFEILQFRKNIYLALKAKNHNQHATHAFSSLQNENNLIYYQQRNKKIGKISMSPFVNEQFQNKQFQQRLTF